MICKPQDRHIFKTVALSPELYAHAEALAQQLGLSLPELFESALAGLIQSQRGLSDKRSAATPPTETTTASETAREIRQGDIFWLQVDPPGSSEPGVPHPHVVIQDNLFNHSRIDTVVVCAVTSNCKRATEPGNVLLAVGEADLTRQSVVVVSQLASVAKSGLGAYIGSLSPQRVEQILDGLRFQQTSFFGR